MKVERGIQPATLSEYDMERLAKAKALEYEKAKEMIKEDGSKGRVRV